MFIYTMYKFIYRYVASGKAYIFKECISDLTKKLENYFERFMVLVDLVDRYGKSVSQMTTDMFHLS